MQYLCQACLRTGENVSLMTAAELHTFREFICKASHPLSNYLHICVFCRSLLRKLLRFIKQCQSSQELLKDIREDTKLVPTAIPVYDLRCTAPEHVHVGDEPLPEGTALEGSCSEERLAGGGSSDEDDVPLVMLRSTGSELGEDVQCEQSQRRENGETVRDKKRQGKKKTKQEKQKKPLREGFTSRMVQETDEYVVIKLTKEQVVAEMAARAGGERYRLAPYRCARCVLAFNFEDVLAAHMERHSPKHGVVQCELCGQYCAGAVSLRGHMKSHTTRYRCKVCGLVRRSRQHVLEHHALAHAAAAARQYSCDRCRFTTNKRTVIQHHVRSHAAREPLPCHRCGKLYKNLETLRIHITRHEAGRRLRCARCPLSFVHAAQLRRHQRAAHERRDYYCVECDLPFNSMDTLKLHFQKAKRHRDDSSYKHACAACPQRFVSAGALAAHASAAHGAARRARCPLCVAPRLYASRAALRVHLRRAHPAHQRKSPPPALAADGHAPDEVTEL